MSFKPSATWGGAKGVLCGKPSEASAVSEVFPGKAGLFSQLWRADFIEKVEDKHDQTAGKRTGVYFNFLKIFSSGDHGGRDDLHGCRGALSANG